MSPNSSRTGCCEPVSHCFFSESQYAALRFAPRSWVVNTNTPPGFRIPKIARIARRLRSDFGICISPLNPNTAAPNDSSGSLGSEASSANARIFAPRRANISFAVSAILGAKSVAAMSRYPSSHSPRAILPAPQPNSIIFAPRGMNSSKTFLSEFQRPTLSAAAA